ncbi:MAG: hypothetical protein BMS9Abin05_0932 [Rhodothermia bacterium]|nr:MAG: hypothetical protein BMS9Abin05_0932 [Rhodothermia bacterium]
MRQLSFHSIPSRGPTSNVESGSRKRAGLSQYIYVDFHEESGQDRFYGGGGSGYYVYNITDRVNPELLVTITGVPSVSWGHTFTPTPNGNFAVGETEFRCQPLRIFDLRPALNGEVDNIDHAVGAWHADWQTLHRFWALKMEGFDGWNGADWGMPNISCRQDWDQH